MSTATEIPVARPSSTVVLARDADRDGPELFMVQRHARSSFGAAYAFPGGVVDDADTDVVDHCDDVDCTAVDTALATDNAIAYYVAAIRELFEEVGILLADCNAQGKALENARAALNAGSLHWNDFVRETGMCMRCNELHYFSHWITPDPLPKRYTTRFFIARLPDGQTAAHDEGELTASRWLSANEALRQGERGDIKLHYPTVQTLRQLAEHDSVDALLSWARQAEAAGVETIYPQMDASEAEADPFDTPGASQ